MADQFVIETNVPAPPPGGGRKSPLRLALEKLAAGKVGDSFMVPTGTFKNERSLDQRAHSLLGSGWYSCRRVDGGVRIWKIAEPKNPAKLRAIRVA